MAIKEKKDLNSFTIPEGKRLKDFKIFCKKHGDITKSASFFNYTTTADGKKSVHRAVFCIPCICEYLVKLQSEGQLAEIAAVPIIEDIPEGETEVADEEIADEAPAEPTDEKTE